MRFPIRPGKVSCAGIVAIMMVLPNSIWKGADASPAVKSKAKNERQADKERPRVRFRAIER